MASIEDYRPEWATDFKALNMAWLEQYFQPEPFDQEVLSHPEQYILDSGGAIFFVVESDRPLGTVAIMYNQQGELELTKMAVSNAARGRGFGNYLMQAAIDAARTRGARELVLYSNTLLAPAIGLYRKFGFKEVGAFHSEYERCNIKMSRVL